MYTLVQERPSDAPTIERLYEAAFGPGRYTRAAERLRETNRKVDDLCFIAEEDGALAGSVRFWPVMAGQGQTMTPGLMLGPLAVQPHRRRNGMGVALIQAGLARATEAGVPFVFLVGDEPYYSRAGFQLAATGRFEMPGPVDAHRLLVRELCDGGAEAAGKIIPAPAFANLAAFAPPAAQKRAAN